MAAPGAEATTEESYKREPWCVQDLLLSDVFVLVSLSLHLVLCVHRVALKASCVVR